LYLDYVGKLTLIFPQQPKAMNKYREKIKTKIYVETPKPEKNHGPPERKESTV